MLIMEILGINNRGGEKKMNAESLKILYLVLIFLLRRAHFYHFNVICLVPGWMV